MEEELLDFGSVGDWQFDEASYPCVSKRQLGLKKSQQQIPQWATEDIIQMPVKLGKVSGKKRAFEAVAQPQQHNSSTGEDPGSTQATITVAEPHPAEVQPEHVQARNKRSKNKFKRLCDVAGPSQPADLSAEEQQHTVNFQRQPLQTADASVKVHEHKRLASAQDVSNQNADRSCGVTAAKAKKPDSKTEVRTVNAAHPPSKHQLGEHVLPSHVQQQLKKSKHQDTAPGLQDKQTEQPISAAGQQGNAFRAVDLTASQNKSSTSRATASKLSTLEPPASTAAALPGVSNKRSVIDKMRARLQGGHFRYMNELLYTSSGQEAFKIMQRHPDMFVQYHEGFQSQTHGWPVQPVDLAIEWLRAKPAKLTVADFGCGDAKLAASVPQDVKSFDLVAKAPGVVACNMANVPEADSSVDVAVFSLALMGTDYGSFLEEAYRILKPRGWLWVAEVRSRFADDARGEDFGSFLVCLKKLGFELLKQNTSNKMFVVFVLRKVDSATKAGHINWPALKPCMYKKR